MVGRSFIVTIRLQSRDEKFLWVPIPQGHIPPGPKTWDLRRLTLRLTRSIRLSLTPRPGTPHVDLFLVPARRVPRDECGQDFYFGTRLPRIRTQGHTSTTGPFKDPGTPPTALRLGTWSSSDPRDTSGVSVATELSEQGMAHSVVLRLRILQPHRKRRRLPVRTRPLTRRVVAEVGTYHTCDSETPFCCDSFYIKSKGNERLLSGKVVDASETQGTFVETH